jgi:hypothetical protein
LTIPSQLGRDHHLDVFAMRRLSLALIVAVFAPVAALAQSLAVNIDQAARITLTRPAGDVVVGNPGIADVTVLDARHLMLTGKAYGVTNLMVADQAGHTIFSRQVVVSAPDVNRISLYRGPDVYNFACSPRCERTPMPGERGTSPGVYDNWVGGYTNYAERNKNAQQNSTQTSAGGQ